MECKFSLPLWKNVFEDHELIDTLWNVNAIGIGMSPCEKGN